MRIGIRFRVMLAGKPFVERGNTSAAQRFLPVLEPPPRDRAVQVRAHNLALLARLKATAINGAGVVFDINDGIVLAVQIQKRRAFVL